MIIEKEVEFIRTGDTLRDLEENAASETTLIRGSGFTRDGKEKTIIGCRQSIFHEQSSRGAAHRQIKNPKDPHSGHELGRRCRHEYAGL